MLKKVMNILKQRKIKVKPQIAPLQFADADIQPCFSQSKKDFGYVLQIEY